MYTQCPDCLSVFSLDAHALSQAHGHVICGHCEAGFDSLATLTDQLPPEPFQELAANEPAMAPPRIELVVYRPQPPSPPVAPDLEASAHAPSDDPADFSQLVFAPRFARKPPRAAKKPPSRHLVGRSGERRWPWVIAALLLLLALGAQLAWAERERLIRHPVMGDWLRSTCATLHCTLPHVAAPDQIHLLATNVQAHPSVADALMISASIRNDAHFTQPYPVLTITLSNAENQRVSMRRLQPREYLDDPAARHRGLAPGASAVLLLEVKDPGDEAVAFEFGFE